MSADLWFMGASIMVSVGLVFAGVRADEERIARMSDRSGRTSRDRFPARRGTCRFCGGLVAPPRYTFCGPRCLRDFFMATDWKRVREVVLTRDCNTCMECGKGPLPAGQLDVHHIIPVSLGGEEWALDNLETLCRDCHKVAHKARG